MAALVLRKNSAGMAHLFKNPSKEAHDLVPVRIAGYHGRINRRHDTPPIRKELYRLLACGFRKEIPFHASLDRKVYRKPFGTGHIYIKQYYITNLRQFVKTLFFMNKAQKSWRYGRLLTQKGIPTPIPIAYLQKRHRIISLEHILVTQGVPNSVTLRNYVDHWFESARGSAPHKKEVIKKLAELLGGLHVAGIYHGDFTAHNLIVERRDAPEYVRIYLTDLDAVDSSFWISSRRRIKNLDEIGRNFLDLRMISTSDRGRFLKYYLNTYTRETRSFKRLFTEVLARTRYRLNKYAKDFIR
jgi:tRNA A-37 threonylcarbamoyl transferase component Bud32